MERIVRRVTEATDGNNAWTKSSSDERLSPLVSLPGLEHHHPLIFGKD